LLLFRCRKTSFGGLVVVRDIGVALVIFHHSTTVVDALNSECNHSKELFLTFVAQFNFAFSPWRECGADGQVDSSEEETTRRATRATPVRDCPPPGST
jgi:hypothetical protein